MLHKNDDHAEPGWNAEDHPTSVKTGRTNDEVKADPDYEWHSDRPAGEAEVRVGAGEAEAEADEPWPETPTWDGPTADELAALDDARGEGQLGRSRATRSPSPTSTRCCSRAATTTPSR